MGRVFVARVKINPKLTPELFLKRLVGAQIGLVKIDYLLIPPKLSSEFFLILVGDSVKPIDKPRMYRIGADNFLHIISSKTVIELAPNWRAFK